MAQQQHIQDLFEEKARKGDGAFAIAYALIELAEAQGATAGAIRKLGLAEASTPFGALEALGMTMKESAETTAQALQSIADAMQRD